MFLTASLIPLRNTDESVKLILEWFDENGRPALNKPISWAQVQMPMGSGPDAVKTEKRRKTP